MILRETAHTFADPAQGMVNGIFIGVPRNALTSVNRFAAFTDASVVDLTFASVLPGVAKRMSNPKPPCKQIFASVPLVPAFVNEQAARRYECQDQDNGGQGR